MNKSDNQKILVKTYLATGAIIISIAPLVCDGKYCLPLLSTPDLPSQGGFYDDFQYIRVTNPSSTLSASSFTSGTYET